MIVCVCKTVTRDQIVEAFKSDTLHKLYEKGMSGICGACTVDVRDIVEDLQLEEDDDEKT